MRTARPRNDTSLSSNNAIEELTPSAEEMKTIDKLVGDETEPVPPTPALGTQSVAPVRPQDVPVLPATPLLDYAAPGRVKSPLPKQATPVVPKAQPVAASEPKGKKKGEKAAATPTMAAVAKAPAPNPPTPVLSKAAPKEPASKKAKPPTLPPLSAVIAAATAEPSPTSIKSEATASPKVIKLPAINQADGQATLSTTAPPNSLTGATVPTPRARTMRIISSSATPTTKEADKEKENVKEKDAKVLPDIHPLSTASAATRQGTRPATPASELISDTASTTSSKRGSISSPMVRSDSVASSNIVVAGKAKSKSALKKERQALTRKEEKQKEVEKEVPPPTQSPTVEDHAPVVARARKKEKKGKAAASIRTGKVGTTPDSPKVSTPVSTHAVLESDPRDDVSSRAGSVSVPAPYDNHREQAHVADHEQHETGTDSAQDFVIDFNPSDIIIALHMSGEINFRELEMLKPVVGLQQKFDITPQEINEFGRRLNMANMAAASASESGDPQISVEITTSAVLEPSASVSLTGSNAAAVPPASRLIVTPGGMMLKGLSPEQEAKFIRLEERSSKSPSPLKSPELPAASLLSKKDLPATLAGSLASKAAGLADLSLEDTLAYLNQLNQFLEFSPETAAAASQFQGQLPFTAGKLNPLPPPAIQPLAPGSSKSVAAGPSGKKGKTPPSTAAGPPPSPINPASVASAAVAAAAGSLEQMLMLGFQTAFGSKPGSDCAMSVEDAEKLLMASRKETEVYEKKLNNLVKRNHRLIFGALDTLAK